MSSDNELMISFFVGFIFGGFVLGMLMRPPIRHPQSFLDSPTCLTSGDN